MPDPLRCCAACGSPTPEIVVLGGLRRSRCLSCHHSQRIDVETFDYAGFAMGATGAAPERVAAQADFIGAEAFASARALEIGCAAGDLAQELRRRFAFAAYHGIEFSPARDVAARRLDRVFSAPVEDLLASGEIQAETYDLVLSSHCLEHLEDPSVLIAAMKRAMKPGGSIFIETPNGGGHPRLSFDDNRTHLHFFCASSLTRLLARHGLESFKVETGGRLDARYSDSLRLLARPLRAFAPDPSVLSGHPLLARTDRLVVWGAGRMVDEMLAHFFDAARIAFFVDKDERKQGGVRLGRPVKAPQAIETGEGWTVLINSIENEQAIREEIATRFYGRVCRVIALSELLD
ncbi:SAM-dependent methyltransferase [Rhodoblastus acidophilus]|uniref:class I SAM-dependent methyltransferase n=1 Tax=Rhodoblastus acidophilus TaxID=1074 RepID=UPI0022253BD7|nr:class I SAM-dependent methyltransferase [Rhodoblastus acidophilus]MCW2314983.1 SAM-dependent methyltransferase [Rhodoblastus acidophilus]